MGSLGADPRDILDNHTIMECEWACLVSTSNGVGLQVANQVEIQNHYCVSGIHCTRGDGIKIKAV